jgi:hypothetical protein
LKQSQVIPPIIIPESGQFYRQSENIGHLLVYTPVAVQEMGDYTRIELRDCPSAGLNAYVRLADIESGIGYVYLAPLSGPWQMPLGCLRLGIERVEWPEELLELSIEQGEPGPEGRQGFLFGTLQRVLPLGRR